MSNETHTLEPFYTKDSKILILGSFPSVASREAFFYYHHPQNRFWPILGKLTKMPYSNIQERAALLRKNHIALYDVIESCSIEGSSDSKITNVLPSDLSEIFEVANIEVIITNGTKAATLYKKYHEAKWGKAIALHSTSAANASWSLAKLLKEWKILKDYLP